MRSMYACLVVLCCLAVTVEGGNRHGLVCFWDFDAGLTDSAGSHQDVLTGWGKQPPRFVKDNELPGVVGKALAIGARKGDVPYLTSPLSSDSRLGPDYTIESWIHPVGVGGWGRLVLNWGGAPEYAYHLAIHNGTASLFHGQADGSYVSAEGGTLQPGRWYHTERRR